MLEVVVHKKELKDILKLCREQNPKAQQMLYDRYAPRILSICRQYFKDMHTAENLMVASILKVFRHLDSYRDDCSFEGWIHRITVHQCIDHIRLTQRNKLDFPGEPVSDSIAADEISDFETMDSLQAMIDRLPESCRVVFILFVIDGYKHHEIAETLGISEGTSKSQLAYARKLLQSMVKQEKLLSV